MSDKETVESGEIHLNLSGRVARGEYCNFVAVSHSPSEFVLDFARVMPAVDNAPVVSRLIMTPDSAKRFLYTLHRNIENYENRYGAITLYDPDDSDRDPFIGGGRPTEA